MSSNKTGFRQGRLGIGKEPIFPLDISGSMRIDGDLVLAGTIADAQGNPIEFGATSATFNMDKTFPDPTIAITEFPDWSGNVVVEGAGKFEDIASKNGDIFYNGGNVGIGTTDPGSYKLYVNGNTYINGTTTATTFYGALSGNATTSTTANNINLNSLNSSSATQYVTFTGAQTGANQIRTDEDFKYYPNTGKLIAPIFQGAFTGNVTGNCSGSSGSCTGNANTASQVFVTHGTTANSDHRINFTNSTGNGNAYIYGDADFIFNPNTGNVGIGTTSPCAKLDIRGPTNDPTTATMSTTSSQAVVRISGAQGQSLEIGGLTSSYSYGLWIQTHNQSSTSNTQYSRNLCLQPVEGNVGIGTVDPETYKLYVNYDGTSWSSTFNASKSRVYLAHGGGYGIAVESTESSSSTYALNLANGDGTWCRAYNNKEFKIFNSGWFKCASIYGDTGLGYHATGYGKHNWHGTSHWAGNSSASSGSYGSMNNWDAYGSHDFIYLGKIHGPLISTGGFIHLSDERIKRDIEDLPDNESLNKVLEIEVRKYGYQDYINKGTYRVTGFIAQEVLKVFPEAVSTNTDGVLPNIYKITTGHNYDISENKLILDVSGISLTEDIKIDSKIQLKLLNHETLFEEDIDVYLKEVNDTNIVLECNKNITEKIEKTQEIFIFGSYVDNIHTVNKDKIFILHHGAIQEIHKEQQADKAEIAKLKTKVTTLESTLETVLARLTELENK